MKKRLLYLLLALFGAPLLWGQSTVVCTTGTPGTVIGACGSSVTSPIPTDPLTFSGAVTFDNPANTPVTLADGATVKAGTGTGSLTVGGVLCKGTGIATTGTSEQVLATCTIPANTLTASGAAIRVSLIAHTSATANNKIVRVRVGGIGGTVVAQSATAAPNNQTILTSSPVLVMWRDATTAASSAAFAYNADATAGLGTVYGYYAVRAAAITWANTNDLVITGNTPGGSGELTLDTYIVEVVQ